MSSSADMFSSLPHKHQQMKEMEATEKELHTYEAMSDNNATEYNNDISAIASRLRETLDNTTGSYIDIKLIVQDLFNFAIHYGEVENHNDSNSLHSYGWNGILTRWAVTYVKDLKRFLEGVNILMLGNYKMEHLLTIVLHRTLTNPFNVYEKNAQQIGDQLKIMLEEFDPAKENQNTKRAVPSHESPDGLSESRITDLFHSRLIDRLFSSTPDPIIEISDPFEASIIPNPMVCQEMLAESGGIIGVPSAPGVQLRVPSCVLTDNVKVACKVVYIDQPYAIEVTEPHLPAQASPIVILTPNGYCFAPSETDAVELTLPLPDFEDIASRCGYDNEIIQKFPLSIWTSRTSEDEEPCWERLHITHKISSDDDGLLYVTFSIEHFSLITVLYDFVTNSMLTAFQLGPANHYERKMTYVKCNAFIGDTEDEEGNFALIVTIAPKGEEMQIYERFSSVVGQSEELLLNVGQYKIKITGKFEAGDYAWADNSLEKTINFRGRNTKVEFLCKFIDDSSRSGPFGRVSITKIPDKSESPQSEVQSPADREGHFILLMNPTEGYTVFRRESIRTVSGVSAVFPLVADLISTDWKALADAFGLRYEDIKRIEKDYDDTNSRARAVLETWKLRDGSKANLQNLIEILQKENFKSISEAVEDRVKRKI